MISLVQCVSPYFAVFLVQIYYKKFEILELQEEGTPSPLHPTFSSYLVPGPPEPIRKKGETTALLPPTPSPRTAYFVVMCTLVNLAVQLWSILFGR